MAFDFKKLNIKKTIFDISPYKPGKANIGGNKKQGWILV